MNNADSQNSKVKFEHYEEFHDVTLRILLVDDKIGSDKIVRNDKEPSCKGCFASIQKLKTLQVIKCSDKDCAKQGCKLCTIKRLMDDGITNNGGKPDGKVVLFEGMGYDQDYFYWKEKNIECYYCPSIIEDFIDDEGVNLDNFENSVLNESFFDFKPTIDAANSAVQIVGVRDVRTALLLLGHYKFDMLFFDYLLDKRNCDSEDREYSTQFFKFLSTDYEKKAKDKEYADKRKRYLVLDKLKRTVIDNRGPMNKLWIMPITGFNSPFITALQNKKVPLISTRWHIETGADPITTPWQFLVKLNQFIELQLKGCVYKQKDLLTFFEYTGKNLMKMFPEQDGKPNCKFHAFQDFMGAEFSNFIGHFGARPVIRRDALIDANSENKNKSVFSTYVWNTFYSSRDKNDKADKKQLFSLHNLMQLFYQTAATMAEDRNGVMRLRESYRRLRYYIEINGLYLKDGKDDVDENKKKEFEEAMKYIAKGIDVLLVERGEKEDEKLGKKTK